MRIQRIGSDEITAGLVLAYDVKAALRTVVAFVQATIH